MVEAEPVATSHPGKFIAESPIMKRVAQQAQRAASVDTPVLITGEPGSGKTFLATEIHRSSRRRSGPFVRYSAAQPDPETRLFGTVGDAARGLAGECGAIQHAGGGTLLIDEIASLGSTSQARLLTAIETGMISPLGGGYDQPVDVRVVAATSKNLDLEVKAGRFRRDLLYRISVLPIHLPPLRSHREDIPALVREFLRRSHRSTGESPAEMDSRLINILKSLDWPRNIRQLKEVVESMATSRSANRTSRDTGPGANNSPLALVEKDTILAALEAHEGNRTRAARSLGISVRTLQRRLRQWHLDE